jgi:hypothetical protein
VQEPEYNDCCLVQNEDTQERKQVESKADPRKVRSPEWAFRPLSDFLDHAVLLDQVLHITRAGISTLLMAPGAVEWLAEQDGTTDQHEFEESLKAAKFQAELAEREISSDFPIIHSQAVVSIWSGLENLIHTLLAQWVMNRPDTLLRPAWKNLKITLGDYEALDQEEKAHYVVGILEQTLAAPLRQGVNRFETLLSTIGLDGYVPEEIKRPIFEMQQCRNVIVHKRGIVDKRFCDACPWLKMTAGERLSVGHKVYRAYDEAAGRYMIEVMYRTAAFFGYKDVPDRPRVGSA